MSPIVGIDLGTTNSAIGYLSEAGPALIPNALGNRLTPSVVGIDESGAVLVGAAVRELQVTRPERCVSLFKRHMGTEKELSIAGRKFSPEELSGLVLRSLKADAEAFFDKPVTRAVITVPAYFNDQQRKSTIAAGRIAGLSVERILNEPTAAAIAYGFHEAQQDKTILVFDLGGGTFDVSVVELFEGTLEVRASAGEVSLGGEDFTRSLAARILEGTGTTFERAEAVTPLLVSRLIRECEKAKCQLSRADSVVVRIPSAKGDLEGCREVPVSRQQLEDWIAPILARVELPVRRVLSDSRLTREKIDEVILVGGATRMPVVQKRVQDYFGREPHCRLNPDEVVALGAAVQAGLFARDAAVEDLVVTDVSPFTLGIAVTKEFSGEIRDGYFDPVIERNTTIPVSRAKTYSTVHPNQTAIVVNVFQGESRKTAENLLIGTFEVTGIPPGGHGQQVEIRFTYDLNGVLEVEATIVKTKKSVSHIIARNAHGMTEAQIREAVRQMAKLKIHPREDSANRYVLARAERLYKELATDLRQLLGHLMDGFEAALDSQNPLTIRESRDQLDEFLNHYDPSGDNPTGNEP